MSDESTNDILSHIPNEEETVKLKYDVFLCYDTDSEEDKRMVKEIAKQLKKREITPWLDDWEVRPGTLWQSERQKQIKYIPAAVVFVGQNGIGRLQQLETEALLIEFVGRQCFVIPVHLPNASNEPELPSLLKGLQGIRWVDSRDIDPYEDPLNRLIWGITGKRPEAHQASQEKQGEVAKSTHKTEAKISSHILIALLRESPVAISAMYDLLTERKGLMIDQVIVLCPKSGAFRRASELVKNAFTDTCELQYKILPLEDANNWRDACMFLKELYTLLDECQTGGDTVYLSLAGGDKSMVALMTSITSFFSCIEHLYHIIEPDEEYFLSIDDLELGMNPAQRQSAMHPDLERCTLVDIPFEPRQQINQQFISFLLTATEDELTRMQDQMGKVPFVQTITQGGKILETLVTERTMKQFYIIYQHEMEIAKRVRDCFELMQSTVELRNFQPDSFLYRSAKYSTVYLHSFTSFDTPVHPIFYTRPKDIYIDSDNEVKQMVICELDGGKDANYRSLQEIVASPDFSIKPAYYLNALPRVPIDSVLIVPLGETSMIATQLYILLKHQERHNIRKVILVYPEQAPEIANGVDIIESALQEEDVPCIYVGVPNLKDVDSPEACKSYQATLEKVIEQAQKSHPSFIIDLAISGGHESMTAMTIFAAQKEHLPYVYHMLFTDKQWSQRFDNQMTVGSLKGLSREKRNERLFLRAYEGEGVYTKLALFKIPVFPT